MNKLIKLLVFLFLINICIYQNTTAQLSGIAREKLLMDYGWSFKMGNIPLPDYNYNWMDDYYGGVFTAAFNDSMWRKVDLPHDWAVELPFVYKNTETATSHGYKPVGDGYPETSKAIYRKVFTIPKTDDGKRISIKFDGVFRNCTVWLNSFRLGNNYSGYSEFTYDITDMINYGEKNTLVVHVDASQMEGWFYEGTGIYRHTWLIKTAPLHIPAYGNQINSTVSGNSAKVNIETQVFNQDNMAANCEVESKIVDANGKIIGSANSSLALNKSEKKAINKTINVSNPSLWDIDNPYLYQLITTIKQANKIIDVTETNFGIRTISFDANKGFFLNGKNIKIKGTCNHQDHAGVGMAMPDRLQYYRIEKLKEMGCNAYRTAHHPPTIELLEACDRLGMMVCDENRILGTSEERLKLFEEQIIRDRNHPSIIMWSIGNEEVIQDTDYGRRIALSLQQLQKKLDPQRLCIYAANNKNNWTGINSVIDIRGYNYSAFESDGYHKDHPNQIMMGSEESSALSTRGQYTNDSLQAFVSDYDVNAPFWGSQAERWWKYYDARPYMAGAYVWTGFDYRGEPTPYEWPNISSHFGIMDVCGFPKSNFYYYQSWWTEKDVLHLFPHWNWQGKTGDTINVWCHTNAESVELFLNGKSQGNKMVEKNGHAEWKVMYEPGTLEAKGIKKGKTITDKIETTGNAHRLVATPDRKIINADGEDVSIVNITAVDEKGREVATASEFVQFEITGNGKIIGAGNGNPSSHEPDKILSGNYYRKLFNGKCQVLIQAGRQPGEIKLKATSEMLQPATVVITEEKAVVRAFVE